MNRDLYGKTYDIPISLLNHLQKYSNNETISHLLSSGKVSYSQLKKLKHQIENGQREELGGNEFYSWIHQTLDSDRRGVETNKRIKSNAGIENSHIRSHEKNDLRTMNRPSKSHYGFNDDIKIMENLKRINDIINKII